MSQNASRSVAVVGVGAVLPDAPNAAALLGEPEGRAVQHHRDAARTLGPRAVLRRGSARASTRPTPRSAAGCGTTSGRPSSGASPCRRGSPTPWIVARSGRSAPAARRCSTTATRTARSMPSAPPSCSATPWPATSTTSRPSPSTSPSTSRSSTTSRASPRCRRATAGPSSRSCGRRSTAAFPASARTACRASWATSSPGGWPTCSTSAVPTTSSTPPARRRWPPSTPPSRGSSEARTTPCSRAGSTPT